MLDALASAAWKRPWAFLGAAVALLAILAIAAIGVRDRLGHPSGSAGEADVVAVTTAPERVSGQVYDVALEAITAGLQARPGVEAVTVTEPVGPDGVATVLIDVSAASAAEQRRIADRLAGEIDPGPLDVRVEGRIAELLEAEETALEDLWRLELLVVPLAVLALAAGLGTRLMAGPLLCAAIAVAGALAGLGLAGGLADLSLLATVAAAGVGLALGIELPALLAARWRDEIRLDEPEAALRNTLADTTDALGFAALCAALAGAGIAAAFVRDAFEPGLAVAVAVALAAAFALVACLLVMPPLLALDGRRARDDDAEPRRESRLASAAGALPRVLARGNLRTALGLALATAACLALGYPALDAATEPLAEVPANPLSDELPVVAGCAALALLVAFVVRARTLRTAPLALVALLPAASAMGLATLVFNDGTSAFGLALDQPRAPATGAVALGVVIVGAIASARAATALDAVRFERALDPGATGVAERAGGFTIPGALLSTLICGAAFGVLTGDGLHAAQELGVMVAAGLLLDLLLRAPVLAALARWGFAADRLGWRPWRKRVETPQPRTPQVDSPT